MLGTKAGPMNFKGAPHELNLQRMRDTEDRIEGRNAFKEKRKPKYRGK